MLGYILYKVFRVKKNVREYISDYSDESETAFFNYTQLNLICVLMKNRNPGTLSM